MNMHASEMGSNLEAVHPLTPLERILSPTLGVYPVKQLPDQDQSLPLAQTQVGNVFRDRFVANLYWYLPTFTLADEPDQSFSFAATQTGVDANGNPFNRASVSLSVKKIVPPDVLASQQQNATAEFREIPLAELSATLSITSKDANGVDQHSTYAGTVNAQADGSLRLSFDNILGVAVIIAYENLAQIGGAQVTLSATYDEWVYIYIPPDLPPIDISAARPWTRVQPAAIRITPVQAGVTEASAAPILAEHAIPLIMASIPLTADHAVSLTNLLPRGGGGDGPSGGGGGDGGGGGPPPGGGGNGPPPPPAGTYIRISAHLDIPLALGQKYAGPAYKQNFTVADGGVLRPILSADDLKNYNVRQSEFSEFLALGDISTKYPSFSRLYIGVLSRTIIAIPARYAIVRGSTGCAAVCQALLDSSPLSTSGCRFQFAFSLAPVVSPIDLLQLSQDIGAYSGSKDCTLQLPTQLDSSVSATLVTPFKSACVYAGGPAPHEFSLAVQIVDDQPTSPAVALANLFIKQLSASVQPYLFGSFGIKLDDYYPTSIEASVSLNFHVTGGTDELGYTIDETQQLITLLNNSPLDLLLTRSALYTPSQLTITPLQLTLVHQNTTSMPLPADHTGLSIMVDRTLALEEPLTKQYLGRYLAFETQDVQEVQYELGVNASGVNFAARGISHIDVQISFAALPNISVPPFSLSADRTVNSTRIVIPVENAVTALAGTLAFTVQFTNPQQSPQSFTRTNDFIDQAIFVLQDADLSG